MSTSAVFQGDDNVRNVQALGGPQFQLNHIMLQWKAVVVDYERQAELAGEAEANYRFGKAAKKRQLLLADTKMSDAKATTLVEADEEVYQWMLEHRIETARLDAMQKKLRWLESEYGRLRSLVVNEREENKLDARHQPG